MLISRPLRFYLLLASVARGACRAGFAELSAARGRTLFVEGELHLRGEIEGAAGEDAQVLAVRVFDVFDRGGYIFGFVRGGEFQCVGDFGEGAMSQICADALQGDECDAFYIFGHGGQEGFRTLV